MSSRRLTYSFGPVEQHGLLGTFRAGQLACLGVGLLLAVAMLDITADPPGALAGLLLLALCVAVAFLPVAGHPLERWASVAVAFWFRASRGQTQFESAAPGLGTRIRRGTDSGLSEQIDPAQPPWPLRDVSIVEIPGPRSGWGALSEQRGRRLTAVLACRVSGFSLLDPEAQERRLARWGVVLSGAGGTSIRRLQWIERTAPAHPEELARWLYAERDPSLPNRGTPIVDSYLELIEASTHLTREHEVLLAVQIDARAARGRQPASTALIEATERVARGLEAAEVVVLGALGPRQLARAVRTAYDPYARLELATLQAGQGSSYGVPVHSAWPTGARERWDHYRSDGAVHATYWIAAWPRVAVSPLFMSALLSRSETVRTISVTFEPLAADRATRQVEAAVTRDRADRELRARFGQSETARHRQAHEAARRREAELAGGHGEVRLSGYVTVSAQDEDHLRHSCSEVIDHAARAHLELHRLYGQQAEAFTFTLPLARGLR